MESRQHGPTLRAQWLGQQLRELRETTGHKMTDAAEYLQRSQATVSRFETAEYPIRRGDVLALVDLYGVSDERQRERLVKLAEEVWRKGWWNGYAEHVPGSLMDYTWLEDRAVAIRSLDLLTIPGLLQVPDYAEAMIASTNADSPFEQREHWVEFRMARQKVLVNDAPPQITSLLDEALLYRQVGGAETMRAQLQYLARVAEQPGVKIRLLPFSAGAHPGNEGAFTIVDLAEPYPAVAFTETPAGSIYVETPDTDKFLRIYDRLYGVSLGADESAERISAAARSRSEHEEDSGRPRV